MNPQESATDRELDQFYGAPPTEAQVQESIRRFTESFDADDLAEIVSDNAESILGFLMIKSCEMVPFMDFMRCAKIARLVSMELYGKYGVITAKDIK